MTTRKELLEIMERRSKELVGTRFKYNPLNAFRGYKYWNKVQMEEYIRLYLS